MDDKQSHFSKTFFIQNALQPSDELVLYPLSLIVLPQILHPDELTL